MWRKDGVGLGLAALVTILIAREWLVRSEISTMQTEIQSNIKDQFSSIVDVTRLDRLSSAPTVYERFLEPVILKTNKLISPFARADILNSWRRDVHQMIDDEIYKAEAQLKSGVDKRVAEILQTQEPSITRLLKVVEEKSRLVNGSDVSDAVKAEVQGISAFAREQDQKTLASIRSQGIESLNLLKSKMQKLDTKGLGTYVSTGKFTQEIIDPVTTLIFKLRTEESRKRTWAEFNRSLEDLLTKRRARLAQNSKKFAQEEKIADDAKRFQKLFNQVADAIGKEEAGATAAAPSPAEPKSADNPASLDYDDSSTMTR